MKRMYLLLLFCYFVTCKITKLYSYGKKSYKEDLEWSFPITHDQSMFSDHINKLSYIPSRGVRFEIRSHVFSTEDYTNLIGHQRFYGTKIINLNGTHEKGLYYYNLQFLNNTFLQAFGNKTKDNIHYYLTVIEGDSIYLQKNITIIAKKIYFRHCFHEINIL